MRRVLPAGVLVVAASVLLAACQPASSASGGASLHAASASSTTQPRSVGPSSGSARVTTAPQATTSTTIAPVGALVVGGSALTGSAPPAGSCHIRNAADGQPLPDPTCTPGAIDAAVSQGDIATTICRVGYTATVRPPVSVTEPFKLLDEKAYSTLSGELDHLIPLELGGSSDAHNLWVEPGSIPNPKDTVENDLHAAVCRGQVSLATAQRLIATDWTTALAQIGQAGPPAPAPTTINVAPAPTTVTSAINCSASMSNPSPAQNSTTDVLITTAPGASLTVTAHYKSKDATHTATADGTGHASVPFDISRAAIDYTVEVDISASANGRTATCSAAFTPH